MTLKAYYGYFKGEDWGTLVHGETRGKAKQRFARCEPSGFGSEGWNDIRLQRKPSLDDIPFTWDNAKKAGFEYLLDDSAHSFPIEEFVNDCDCEICKKGQKQ